jgi:hypothetical protein
MKANGDNGYRLWRKSGIPAQTTYRFLNGKHDNPDSATVQQWADVYGVTESQLRGDVPIDNLIAPKPDPVLLKNLLSPHRLQLLDGMDKISKEAQGHIEGLVALLSNTPRERRKKNVPNNPQIRAGEVHHDRVAKGRPRHSRSGQDEDANNADCRSRVPNLSRTRNL